MSKKDVPYRKIIQAIVGSANKYEAVLKNSLIYDILVKWLKDNDIRLDKDLFRVVLAICKELSQDSDSDIDSVCKRYEMLLHTETHVDGIHTDYQLYKGYVEKVLPIMRAAVEEEMKLGDYNLRLRSVDVVDVGRLFDAILLELPDSKKDDVLKLMNGFMANLREME